MAIIPVVKYIIEPPSNNTNLYHWPNMGSGDEGEPIHTWAFPIITFQYTGTLTDDVNKPWPILDILGTQEGFDGVNPYQPASCWGVIRTIRPPSSAVMIDHEHDPCISLPEARGWLTIKPKMRVTANANRASLFLVTARQWGPR